MRSFTIKDHNEKQIIEKIRTYTRDQITNLRKTIVDDLQVKYTSTFTLLSTVNNSLQAFIKKFEDQIQDTIEKIVQEKLSKTKKITKRPKKQKNYQKQFQGMQIQGNPHFADRKNKLAIELQNKDKVKLYEYGELPTSKRKKNQSIVSIDLENEKYE